MKAWQLTTGLAVLAVAAGQLPQFVAGDDAPPVRARLDRVVGDADYGFAGPEDHRVLIGFDPRPSATLDKRELDAIDSTIRAERQFKRCFFDAQKQLGYLPDVIVRFRIDATGEARDAAVVEPATLEGSTLEACLSRAFESTQFPPFEGNGVWLTYPFKF